MNDLTARIDEALRLTPEGAPGPWMVDYCGGGEYLISSEIGPVGRFTAASGEGDSDEAYAMGAAPDFRLLLVEARAQIAAQAEALARVEREAAAFESNYRGALRDMDGWHGPLYPEDEGSVGLMPALAALLGAQS